MSIDNNQIKQLAEIAALELPPEELEAQAKVLNQYIGFTEELLSIDTTDLPLDAYFFGEKENNCLREDEVTNEDHAKELVSSAPDSKENYFRVPRTVEE